MTMEIGALLGNIGDGAQSFESLGSWDITSIGTTTFSVSNVSSGMQHSSDLSGNFNVVGAQVGMVSYLYSTSNDLYNRWNTNTNSHNLVSYFWTINPQDFSTSSGQTVAYLNSSSLLLDTSLSYNRHRIQTYANNAETYRFSLDFQTAGVDSYEYFIDDLLTAIDVIDLFPGRNLKLNDELYTGQHQTIGGANPSYNWGFNKKWVIPLKHVGELDAIYLNQWWQDMRPLLFTFDSSDTNQQFIVTMTNKQTPMNNFSKMYHDEWQGDLEFSALNTGLVF